jgi:hypothetical protein
MKQVAAHSGKIFEKRIKLSKPVGCKKVFWAASNAIPLKALD